jgi:transketolase
MRNHLVDRLSEAAEESEAIFLITGDLGYGVLEKFIERYPARFLNAGVAEQNMMGVAAGLAASGFRPWIYSIANFPTFRCLEQIRNDVCYHNLDVTIVSIGSGFSYGTLGYSHFGIEDISVMRPLMGMRIYSPANNHELDYVMDECLNLSGPKYLRIDKGVDFISSRETSSRTSHWNYRKRANSAIVFLTIGSILDEVLIASDMLFEMGIPTDVYSVPKIHPFSFESAALENRLIFSVEEHVTTGGLYSVVADFALQNTRSFRLYGIGVCADKITIVGSQSFLRKTHELDSKSIVQKVVRLINTTEPPSGIEPETFALRERRSTD